MTVNPVSPIILATAGGTAQRLNNITCRMNSRVPTPAKLIGSDEIVRSIGMMAKKSTGATPARKA